MVELQLKATKDIGLQVRRKEKKNLLSENRSIRKEWG